MPFNRQNVMRGRVLPTHEGVSRVYLGYFDKLSLSLARQEISKNKEVFLVNLVFDMPFKSAETPHCPRCGHAAFHAESVPVAGKMWHKICFRCGKIIHFFLSRRRRTKFPFRSL